MDKVEAGEQMHYQDSLVQKIKSKHAHVGIVGLGYVGMPLALRFVEAGFKVTGFDIDESKVQTLNAGHSYIAQISSQRVASAINVHFSASLDFSLAGEMDAIVICVPTPLGRHREPDVSFIENTVREIAPYLRAGQALSLESTTYPGTTEEIIVPA
ncbi:MAG: NAD(P)-binding domain-containing protein, partial [Gammaproteobacteria bacterium]